jgi:quercetin dioxygenase-like cupin family protein
MKIEDVPFAVIDWSQVEPVEYPGEHGTATWRMIEIGNLRVRKVEYSPGYVADHWCARGHVLLVLEGELTTELRDGRRFQLTAGMSYHVAEGAEPHRSLSAGGARLFIVD